MAEPNFDKDFIRRHTYNLAEFVKLKPPKPAGPVDGYFLGFCAFCDYEAGQQKLRLMDSGAYLCDYHAKGE